MTLQNLHTHTVFSDGGSTAEEMVLGAIRAGCSSLGFSDHSPLSPFYDPDRYAMAASDVPAYRSEILRLREKYAGELEIYLGLEQDCDSPAPDAGFDYLIGSVHSVVADGVCLSVDNTREVLISAVRDHFGGDYLALAEAYYQRVGGVAGRTRCQIVGHFDLLTKFNEGDRLFDTGAPRYLDAAMGGAGRPVEGGRALRDQHRRHVPGLPQRPLPRPAPAAGPSGPGRPDMRRQRQPPGRHHRLRLPSGWRAGAVLRLPGDLDADRLRLSGRPAGEIFRVRQVRWKR